jgi:hypothetical protein
MKSTWQCGASSNLSRQVRSSDTAEKAPLHRDYVIAHRRVLIVEDGAGVSAAAFITAISRGRIAVPVSLVEALVYE